MRPHPRHRRLAYWGGRLAQALERDDSVEVIIGVSPHDPTLELERTEFVRVGTQHALLRRIVQAAEIDTVIDSVDHPREDGGQVRDVGDRIVDLALVERAATPVGKARALVQAVAEKALDQVRIANLLAVTERHRRDLRVKQRMWHLAGEIVNDLQVLPAGVKDFQHLLIFDEEVE